MCYKSLHPLASLLFLLLHSIVEGQLRLVCMCWEQPHLYQGEVHSRLSPARGNVVLRDVASLAEEYLVEGYLEKSLPLYSK